MYYHHVLRDLEMFVAEIDYTNNHKKKLHTEILYLFRKAHRFHIGDLKDIDRLNKNKGELFIRENGGDIRLPYGRVWFDYTRIGKNISIYVSNQDKVYTIAKQGALCAYHSDDAYKLLNITPFHYYKEFDLWVPSIFNYNILIDNDLSNIDKAILKENDSTIKQSLESLRMVYLETKPNVAFHHIRPSAIDLEHVKKMGVKEKKELLKVDANVLSVINMALIVLSCKNVITETIHPPEKLIKAHRKRGKLPPYSYKVIKIKADSKNNKAKGTSTGITQRAHFCRGHRKIYTKDKPLFGKIVGSWWWNSHIRGNEEEGVIDKEYEI